MNEDIIFEEHSGTGWIILNRPKALNALSLQMVTKIYHQLNEWVNNEGIFLVCIKSQVEKAFCAGGDIRAIAEIAKTNSNLLTSEYFKTEYKMDLFIHEYPKPVLVYMDGIVMGGGVGLSMGANFRIITERTKWAMPETNIGFFPDVGASYFLNQMPGYVGTYLALTAQVLTVDDILYTNAANYYLHSQDWNKVEDFIKNNQWQVGTAEIQLNNYLKSICQNFNRAPYLLDEKKINQHFHYETMEEIMKSLEIEMLKGDCWAEETRDTLHKKSPTSLKVTLELMRRGKSNTIKEAFEMDVVVAQHFFHINDFFEGVRAVLVDKDHNPKWIPDSLQGVSSNDVNRFFVDDLDDRRNS